MRLVGDISRLNARRFPQKPALRCAGRLLTYGAVDELANRVANGLRARGVHPGDRVAILSANSLEYIPLVFAAAKCAALCVPLNFRSSVDELAYMLNDAQVETLFVGSGFASTAAALRQRVSSLSRPISIAPGVDGMTDLETLAGAASPSEPGLEADEESGVAILYTSGTTGHPKGAVLSHRSVVEGAFQTALATEVRHTDVVLVSVPLFHGGGLMVVSMPHLVLGATLVIQEKFDPVGTLHAIDTEAVTTFFGVPAQYAALLDEAGVEAYALRCLRTLWYGAAPMPPATLERLLALWPRLRFVQSYGQTETTLIASLGPDEHFSKPGATGRELPGIEMRVVNDDGIDVPAGAVGEIIVRRRTGMLGYYNNPQQTHEAIRDGWIYTGDLARIDADRYITVVDRKRDVIVSGGENIYPKEIEDLLGQHPAIAQVAVIGVPDAKWGEQPQAFVVLRAHATADADALNTWCLERMARYKRPRRWVFTDALPATATGKVRKNVLRQMAGEQWSNAT